MNAQEHFQAGQLPEAVAAATAGVKANPSDAGARFLLSELLCFSGDYDRADKHLDAITDLDPGTLPVVSLMRQLIRADQARQQFFENGRLPEFLTEPSEDLRLRLQASIALRDGNQGEAARLVAQAEEVRKPVTGQCDGQSFDDFRDLDDLTSSFLEVLTSNGKYYWMPFSAIETMEFSPVARPRDLLWREARVSVREGPDGLIYLPALYSGSAKDADPQLRLGRATDWRGDAGALIRGVGQKMFLSGESERAILQIKSLAFDN